MDRSISKRAKELIRMNCEIEKTKGYAVQQTRKTLEKTFYILLKNHSELKKCLKKGNIKSFVRSADSDEDLNFLDYHLVEVSRLLHNFLASVITLVDHTRNRIRPLYGSDPFWTDYEKHMCDMLSNKPITKFVHDLRNYCLHYALPIQNAVFKVRRRGKKQIMKLTISLNVNVLYSWNRWKPLSKLYMNSFDAHIPVIQFVEDYFKLVDDFYHWLARAQDSMHRKHYAEYLKKYRQFRRTAFNISKKSDSHQSDCHSGDSH